MKKRKRTKEEKGKRRSNKENKKGEIEKDE